MKGKTDCYKFLLFLLSKISKDPFHLERVAIRSFLSVTTKDEELILSNFIKDGTLFLQGENYQLQQSLSELEIKDIMKKNYDSIADFYSILPFDTKKRGLRQILLFEPSISSPFFEKINQITIKKIESNFNEWDVHASLKLLNSFYQHSYSSSFELLSSLINTISPKIQKESQKKNSFRMKYYERIVKEMFDLFVKIPIEPEPFFDLICNNFIYCPQTLKGRFLELMKDKIHKSFASSQNQYWESQNKIIDKISQWNEEELYFLSPIAIEITREILKPSFKSYEIFQTELVVPVTVETKKIRSKTINLIKNFYHKTSLLTTKREFLQVLEGATYTSHVQQYDSEIKEILFENAKILIDFYIEILDDSPFKIKKEIEEQTYWMEKRFNKDKSLDITTLYSKLENDKEYQIFKIFVGGDTEIHPTLTIQQRRKLRAESIDKFIQEINEENYIKWEKRALVIASNYKQEDTQDFFYFYEFLFKLGQQKVNISLQIISNLEDNPIFTPFLAYFLAGVYHSSQRGDALLKVSELINKKKFNAVIIQFLQYTNLVKQDWFEKIYTNAITTADFPILIDLLTLISSKNSYLESGKSLFLSIIQFLSANKNTQWIQKFWFQKKEILDVLNSSEVYSLLRAFYEIPNITIETEEILFLISKNYLNDVILFFKWRIFEKEYLPEFDEYETIPNRFQKLNLLYSTHKKEILDAILLYFENEEISHIKDVIKLLHAFSPKFDFYIIPFFKESFSNKKSFETFLFHILDTYSDQIFESHLLQTVLFEFVNINEKWEEIFEILSKNDWAISEYGVMEEYFEKKRKLDDWKVSSNETVLKFIVEYETYLDYKIKLYKRER
ncbi:hypothetical protein JXR93_02355 [bacterium]|nr:hypothetical protein [bacterium]